MLGSYVIPKGTIVYINLWAIHRDRKYWKYAGDFDPDRFLNRDRTQLVKRDSFMPFGHGASIDYHS